MKIFATSDIHGDIRIIEQLRAVANKVDLVLYCGDLAEKVGTANSQLPDVMDFMTEFANLGVKCKFIRGNVDNFELNNKFYLGAPEKIKGENFIPFEDILTTPFNTNREVGEEQIALDLAGMPYATDSIIVAHQPPFGHGDKLPNGTNIGSRSITEWIENAQPKMWLCGHIHEDYSVSKIGKTLVFNCASNKEKQTLRGWVIDTKALTYESVELGCLAMA
ncbi:metallophosphoesterase [Clostridia bacterium]|nr:metallophosphoesterase [Clostridia bacterium]